jgi:hypothetical protein
MLYSIHNQRPAPLPALIRLSDGRPRTDPASFTAEEIADAGYVGPYIEPAYDAATEQLLWVDGAYVIEALPPPNSNTTLGGFQRHRDEPASHQRDARRRAASCTGLCGGMWVGLDKASEGDSRVFLNAWTTSYAMGLLSAELITTVKGIAGEYDLPEAFIDALAPAE